MRYKFRDIRLSNSNKAKLSMINGIIEEYKSQGYVLTLRQLYYQLVSRDVIPNKQSEYAKLSKLLKEGRMGGIVDWDAIEDRLRVPYIPYWVHDPQHAIEDTIRQYRLNRQMGQPINIEVWVEKDALSGVLKRITSKYHVKLLVNRGYGSVTAIHDAYNRYSRAIDNDQECRILYLGDHDPSGIDMIRDIHTRVNEMIKCEYDTEIYVEHLALTMEQINEHRPPPNPAKVTDPRATEYIRKHGHVSWEVDALEPRVLNSLLSDAIEANMDMNLYNAMLEEEVKDKEKLGGLIKHL